jgi:peptide/nickel transport system substrate-binding protein
MTHERDFDRLFRQRFTRAQLLRRMGIAGVTLSLPAALAACGGGGDADETTAETGAQETGATATTEEGAPKRGGTFTLARNEEPQTFDPFQALDVGSISPIFNIFDQLVTITEDGQDVEPSLAESWEASPDQLTYTFRLRPGVRFSDGTPMTVDDVVFSLNRTRDPDASGLAFLFRAVSAIEAADDSSITITLSENFAPLLGNLAIFASSIVPKATFEADPEGFAQKPVGTGPFALGEFVPGERTRLVRNENYWQDGKPYVDEVVLPFTPDANTRVLNLQGGQVDGAVEIPYAQVEELNQTDDTEVLIEPRFQIELVYLNNDKEPLNDKRVRQALNYATDKEGIIQSVLFGNAEVANHMMPKMKYWREDVPPYAFDLEKARQLLAASPVADGFTLPLIAESGNTVNQQVAQIMKESFAQIGVTVEIESLDPGTAFSRFSSFDYQAYLGFILSDSPDPDELAAIQFDYDSPGGTKSFFTNYRDPQASRLVADGARGTSDEERAAAYGQLQELVMEGAPNIALYFTPARNGVRSHVKGFHGLQTGWWRLQEVWLDT